MLSVFFYVQHLLGIGHLARASLIAQALVVRGAKVTLATGGRPVPGLPGGSVNVIELPSMTAGPGGFSDLIDIAGNAIDDDFRRRRSAVLNEHLICCAPDILVVEAFPFGRRQMRFELLPLLELARGQTRKPLIACSVRDILQARSNDKMRETVNLISSYFDLVLVHGDAQLARLDETFALAEELPAEIVHTGIVSAQPGKLDGEPYDVVVSAGGGIAGEQLLRAAIAARERCSMSRARWCILTGPNLDRCIAEELKASAGPGVSLFASRQDFRALLAHAKLSVSQAGYNTAADILTAGCRSIMVPFTAAGETEQTFRASRLADRGLVALIKEDSLNPHSLAKAIDDRMQTPPIGTIHDIDLDGAGNAAGALLSHASLRHW